MKNLPGTALSLAICLLAGCAAAPPEVQEPTTIQSLPAPQQADPLEAGFQNLADQIVAGLRNQQASQIAVVQFQNLDGSVSEFGGFIAEEMITRLYQTGNFRVVEREMLNKVMAEHELATSGLVDESTAKELGKLLGVDAIATGTITNLGAEVRVNSRLIATETGSVFSAAAVTLPKDTRVEDLMAKSLVPAHGPPTSRSKETRTTGDSGATVFYFEDFTKVEEGMIPDGWIGGDRLQVKPGKGSRGVPLLIPFKKGARSFSVPGISFPEDWEVEIKMVVWKWARYGSDERRQFASWDIGQTVVSLSRDRVKLNTTPGENGFGKTQTHVISVRKHGPVVKLYLDGKKQAVVRSPGLERPESINFSFSHPEGNFGIQSIKVSSISAGG